MTGLQTDCFLFCNADTVHMYWVSGSLDRLETGLLNHGLVSVKVRRGTVQSVRRLQEQLGSSNKPRMNRWQLGNQFSIAFNGLTHPTSCSPSTSTMPSSSACSSVPGTAPGSRVPSLPPISGAAPFMPSHTSVEGSNHLLSRRQVSRGLANAHLVNDSDPDSPGVPKRLQKKYLADPADDNLSVVSVRLDSPPRKARSRVRPAPLRRRPHYPGRHLSASSSEGESPTRHHRNKGSKPPRTRRRGNSLSRLENFNQAGMAFRQPKETEHPLASTPCGRTFSGGLCSAPLRQVAGAEQQAHNCKELWDLHDKCHNLVTFG
ncbi:hypothetical protein E2C01_009746 [Portunus trituberculatus]|uniref:Uncharacterized protein n=1 Tax=Portunus trituberculatus TaxID=210409 RepID=A0A5B7D6T4_PORTR|nr:hypothetical protein [Portunus trituberculatus]